MSLFGHVALLVLAVALHHRVPPPPAAAPERTSVTRLIFEVRPEPAGGDRSGGARRSEPARRATAVGRDPISVPIARPPDPTAQTQPSDIEPVPRPLLAVVPFAGDPIATVGAIDPDRAATSDSRGPGSGDTAGPGDGRGDGDGRGPGSGDDGYGVGNGVSAPRLLRSVSPQYTSAAMRERIQGTVTLECVVDAAGRVDRCRMRRSLDPIHGLDQQALTAARLWSFEPGRREGEPVAVRVTIELAFTIR